MRKPIPSAFYRGFADLQAQAAENEDYAITAVVRAHAGVAIIAPHGGLIEPRTSTIARAIAAEDFSLYLFEGIRRTGNFDLLHLTSNAFDEPRCLELVACCRIVVSVHGFRGHDEQVLIGGLDKALIGAIARSFSSAGIPFATEGHRYPAVDARNICNRGLRGQGVQLEISSGLRKSARRQELAAAVRAAILGCVAS